MSNQSAWWALLLLLAAVGATYPGDAGGQVASPAESSDKEITVDADSMSYDRTTDALQAHGHVILKQGARELHADELSFNRTTGQADAIGNVRLVDSEGVLFASRIHLDLEGETGEMLDATLSSTKLKYTLSGERVSKKVGQNYHIEDGLFTTCKCGTGPPTWSIAAREVDLALGRSGVLRGARFLVRDVPIFYLPKLPLPISQSRQSGLLVPRFGISNRRGVQLLQPVYWAISKSDDATVGLDLESSARVGLVGEYRYAMSETLHGSIGASYFNETIRGAGGESRTSGTRKLQVPENRWSVATEHSERLGNTQAYADLFLVSDDLFLREINTFAFDYKGDVALRTRPFTESRVGFVHSWNRLALHGEGVFYQDLVAKDSLVLQRAPELQLLGQRVLGGRALGEIRASVTDFQRSGGIAGVRADLQPGLQVYLPLGRAVSASVHARFRETAYQLTRTQMEGGIRGDDPTADPVSLPGRHSRETVDLGGEVRTELHRVFEFPHLGVIRLKHSIEPLISYRFIPKVSQNDIMVFDGLDRIEDRNLVSYGFVSRLLARRAPTGKAKGSDVVELGRFSVSQSYDFSRDIPSSTVDGTADHFSDIDLSVRVQPSKRTSLRFASSYDPSTADFSAAAVSLLLVDPFHEMMQRYMSGFTTRTRFSVAYRFVTNDPLKNAVASLGLDSSGVAGEGIQQVDSDVVIQLSRRLGFLYSSRYDVRDNRFLENHFGLRLNSACDCWSVDFGISDKSNPNEVELQARFRLVGLSNEWRSTFGGD